MGDEVSGIRERMHQEFVEFSLGHLALAEGRPDILADELARIEQLVDVSDVRLANLLAVVKRHLLELRAHSRSHDAEDDSDNDRDRSQNHQRLLECQSAKIESHILPLS